MRMKTRQACGDIFYDSLSPSIPHSPSSDQDAANSILILFISSYHTVLHEFLVGVVELWDSLQLTALV